jgi:hypothetical protein
MYTIIHNIDGEKITTLYSDAELVHFTRCIAIENEDHELSILSVGEAKDYLADYCPNLTLISSVLTVTHCTNCPFALREDDGQYICSEINRQNIPWEDEYGFDEIYHNYITPKACPLKKSPLTIVLKR